jgi:hypothetical protein
MGPNVAKRASIRSPEAAVDAIGIVHCHFESRLVMQLADRKTPPHSDHHSYHVALAHLY